MSFCETPILYTITKYHVAIIFSNSKCKSRNYILLH